MKGSGLGWVIPSVLLIILVTANVVLWWKYTETSRKEGGKVERIPIEIESGKKIVSFSDGGKNIELVGKIDKVDSIEGRTYSTLEVENQRVRIDLGPLNYKILVSFASKESAAPTQKWEMMSVLQILNELKPGRVIDVTLASLINADKPPESECDLACELAIQEYERYEGNNLELSISITEKQKIPEKTFGAVQTLMIE